MLKSHIEKKIKKYLLFETTQDQNSLIDSLSQFVIRLQDPDFSDEVMIVSGYAGTGKTTVLSGFVKAMNSFRHRFVLLAPTGRAAKVFSGYSGYNAYTIHKKIYRQKSSKDGFGVFVLDKNLHKNTIFIVDEASMISNQTFEYSLFGSGSLLNDLLEFVYSGVNCKLILVGDTAQLPPVGLDISPALDKKVIESEGFQVSGEHLSEVVRQSMESGILFNASNLREVLNNNDDFSPSFSLSKFSDIEYLSGVDLIDTIMASYDKFGIENCLVVSRSNKRANKYNEGIRQSILWRENQLSIGDYLMVVKNNYFWITDNEKIDFIANGDIVEIVKIKKFEERYNHKYVDVTVRFIDYNDFEIDVKLFVDTLTIDKASFGGEENKNLYYTILEDYKDLKTKKKQYQAVKDNPYFNALQVKFAYAVTCHKAQGGQWSVVFVDQGYITDEMVNKEYIRWLYTAITRATKKLYLINFTKKFIQNFPEN